MLDTNQLKTDLKAAYNQTLATTGSADEAINAFVDVFCDKLEIWVKTATVNYIDGLTAGVNPVVGIINGGLE